VFWKVSLAANSALGAAAGGLGEPSLPAAHRVGRRQNDLSWRPCPGVTGAILARTLSAVAQARDRILLRAPGWENQPPFSSGDPLSHLFGSASPTSLATTTDVGALAAGASFGLFNPRRLTRTGRSSGPRWPPPISNGDGPSGSGRREIQGERPPSRFFSASVDGTFTKPAHCHPECRQNALGGFAVGDFQWGTALWIWQLRTQPTTNVAILLGKVAAASPLPWTYANREWR